MRILGDGYFRDEALLLAIEVDEDEEAEDEEAGDAVPAEGSSSTVIGDEHAANDGAAATPQTVMDTLQSDSEGSVQFAAERDEPERRTVRHLPDHWRQSGYSRSQPAQSIRSVNGDSDSPLSAFSPFLILTELKRTKYNRKHILDIGLQYELHNCIALF